MKKILSKKRFILSQSKGFTLIELMVVMAIIAVLAVLIIGAIQIARKTSTETANRSNARTIQTALEGYYARNKAYPAISGVNFIDATGTGGALNGYGTVTSATPCSTNGGGIVTSVVSPPGYTINVYSSDCSTEMTGDKIVN